MNPGLLLEQGCQRVWRPGLSSARDVRLDLYWLLGLGLLLMGVGIGLRDPWPADEPRFALVAQDMLRSGQWLIPMIGGDTYADKPPLFFWMIATLLGLFEIKSGTYDARMDLLEHPPEDGTVTQAATPRQAKPDSAPDAARARG